MEQIGLTHGGEKAQVQSVLLLTDGLANQGITSKEGILAEMRKMQDQGLHAVTIPGDSPYNPAPQISRAPPNQRRGLHLLFGRNARRQQNQQQQQQMQVQQAGPPPIVQQQMAPPPQPMQQQAVPPPPPQPMQQQQVVPQAMQQQQAVPPPPPPPVYQQQVPLLQVADNPPEGAATKPIPSGAKVSPYNLFFTTEYYFHHSLQFDGTVYTFGFGSDHDATLLEAISTQGGGVYYYIDSNEKVPPQNIIQ